MKIIREPLLFVTNYFLALVSFAPIVIKTFELWPSKFIHEPSQLRRELNLVTPSRLATPSLPPGEWVRWSKNIG
jgi:hypothetical protein